MSKRRVVITGIGMLTPLGLNVSQSWAGLCAGRSGITALTPYPGSDALRAQIAGALPAFESTNYFNSKEIKTLGFFSRFALVAAQEAIIDANLVLEGDQADRYGVAIGSGVGGITVLEDTALAVHDKGARRISPFFIPKMIVNMAAGHVSITHGLRGPNVAAVSACATGAHNIGLAARMIAYGDADGMIAGGSEKASTSLLGMGGFAAARALSTRNDAPEKASRPWDVDRDGFVLSDGAGILVLEAYEVAKARGAHMYAEVAGFGMSGDASHMTLPSEDGAGALRAMQAALKDAKLSPADVDYINAHGTSTPMGDAVEAQAVQSIFTGPASKVLMSSTKSMIGHQLGAAGAVEAGIAALAIRDQIVPPTLNLDNPDKDIQLDLVPHTARRTAVEVVMSNSFGFGGTNTSLLFKAVS